MILAAVGAAVSTVIAVLWGGWSQPMTVLCIMMGLDYLSGVVVALVFRASPKTSSGGMSSEAGLKGLLRKIFLILVVSAAYQIDKAIGTYFLRDAVAFAFIANEALSLVENAGLMGIPIPKVLLHGIEVLKGKAEDGNAKDGGRERADVGNGKADRKADAAAPARNDMNREKHRRQDDHPPDAEEDRTRDQEED